MMVLALTVPVIAMIAMMVMELVERRLADHIESDLRAVRSEHAIRSEHESVTLPTPWTVVRPLRRPVRAVAGKVGRRP